VLRCDFHVHTNWSPDATAPPAEVVAHARAVGLDRIAITDHHEIRGALEARSLAPDLVVVGEEITSDCGTDLLGLFLSERIPAGGTIEQIADAIRAQGGVVYAPHPCAYPRRAEERWARLLAVADVFEVVNGRAFVPSWNAEAARRVAAAGRAGAAGSDAHTVSEVGGALTELPAFTTAAELRTAMVSARAVLRRAPSLPRVVLSLALHAASRAGWQPYRPVAIGGGAWPEPDVWGQRSPRPARP
jgi:predicted metal-dependent phosphoesterase TrpH